MSTKPNVWLPAKLCQLGLFLTLLLGLAGCGDPATRLADELEHEAKALRRSGETTRSFIHKPKGLPESANGAYTVKFVTRGHGYLGFYGNALGCSTSYHRRFVEVPKDLTISKRQGEPVVVVLTRIGDTVQVTELR